MFLAAAGPARREGSAVRARRDGFRDGFVAIGGAISAVVLVAMGTLLVRESPHAVATARLRAQPVAATGAAPTETASTETAAADAVTASGPAPPETAAPPPPAPDPTLPAAPPPLPQPERPPAAPYADVPVLAIGELEIPKVGLHTPLYAGVWRTVIDHGPGHWPGTAEPGGFGNTVIAGHRSTYTQPFRHIDQLLPGDEIVVRTDAGAFTYEVTGSEVVGATALSIVDQAPGHTITLFACHPVGSAAQRYVVRGSLVS